MTEIDELKQQIAFHLQILNSVQQSVIVTDKNAKIILWNNFAQKLYGYTQNEAMGKTTIELISPIELVKYSHEKVDEISNGSKLISEYLVKNKAGKTFPVSLKLSPIYSNENEVIGIVGISEDISERKAIENRLIQSEEKFRTFFETCPDGIAMTTMTGEIVEANKALLQQLGLTLKELRDTNFSDLTPKKWHKQEQENIAYSMKTRSLLYFEKELIKKNGEIYPIAITGWSINDEKGDPKFLGAFVKDISERKLMDAMFHEIIDKNPLSIQIVDKNGFTIKTNPAHTQLFGIVPPTGFSIFDDLQKIGFADFIQRAKNSEVVYFPDTYYNVRHISSNFPDKPAWVKAVLFPLKDIEGNPERFVFMHEDITERKQAEEALRKSEAIKNKMVSNIGDVVVIIDQNNTNKYKSPNITALFGWKPEDMIGKSAWDNIHPDDLEAGQKFLSALVTEPNATGTTELRYKHKNGNYVWIEFKAVNLFHDNDIQGILGNYHDITYRKQAEEALKESDWKFRALFEKGPIGAAYHVMVNDDTGKPIDYFFLDANQAYIELTGVDPRGKLVTEAFPGIENDPFDWIGVFGKVARTGETIHFEQYLESNQRWYDCVGYQYKPDHFVAAFLEITKRKQVELQLQEMNEKLNRTNIELSAAKERAEQSAKALKHSHDLMQYIIEHNRGAVAVHDKNYNYIYVSNGYLKDYKIAEENIIGRHHYQVQPDIPQKWRDVHTRALNGEILGAEEDSYPRADGTLEWTRWECRPWYEADDSIGGFIIYTEIITQRKNMELELKAAKEKAEESDRLKTAFLQNMSHEIRTPMNAICGFSGQLNRPDLSDEKRKSFVSIIQNSSHQLLSIVTDILTISSLETKQEKLNISKVCINNVIVELLSVFKQQSINQNISLYAKKELNDLQSEILTDKTKITQILTNLLTNALKFTHEGYIEFGYTVVQQQNGVSPQELQFYVKDSGIGIKPELHEIIFERFRQADKSIQMNYGGTGLGLSISKGLTELCGGKIWVQSEPTKGATFYFTIPYEPVNEIDKSVAPTNQNNNFKTVLVAEDEEYNFLLIEEYLCKMDLKLIHAKNGKETLEIFNSNPNIDLILMDIKMPITSGYEAAKIIKELKPDLPIVAQSGYALEHELEKYKGIFDDYITKPINENDLIQKVIKYTDIQTNKT